MCTLGTTRSMYRPTHCLECRSTYGPTYRPSVSRYVDREWLSDCRPTCRSIGYRHSADTPCRRRNVRLVTSAEQCRYPFSTFGVAEASLQKSGVVNRTKPSQKSIEPNRSGCCSTGSVIEHIRTGTFRWVRLPFGRKQKASSFNWMSCRSRLSITIPSSPHEFLHFSSLQSHR